jgi:FkbM family methyltransferase
LRATSGELLETAYVNLCARLAPTLSIEVGAREARFSLRLKKRMPDLHAIAFEANPKTHRTFAESLLKEAASVDYRHGAICDRDGAVALNIPVARNGVRFKRTHGISSLLDRKSPGLECDTTTVPALRLDTVIAGLDAAKVVAWIDAEGAQRGFSPAANDSSSMCCASKWRWRASRFGRDRRSTARLPKISAPIRSFRSCGTASP